LSSIHLKSHLRIRAFVHSFIDFEVIDARTRLRRSSNPFPFPFPFPVIIIIIVVSIVVVTIASTSHTSSRHAPRSCRGYFFCSHSLAVVRRARFRARGRDLERASTPDIGASRDAWRERPRHEGCHRSTDVRMTSTFEESIAG